MRFRLATGLTGLTFVAAWLATIQVNLQLASDVRSVLSFFVFAVPLLGAIHYRGKPQAFWLGFLLVFIVTALPQNWPLSEYQPTFRSVKNDNAIVKGFVERASHDRTQRGRVQSFISATVDFVGVLIVASVTGLISMQIYAHARRPSH